MSFIKHCEKANNGEFPLEGGESVLKWSSDQSNRSAAVFKKTPSTEPAKRGTCDSAASTGSPTIKSTSVRKESQQRQLPPEAIIISRGSSSDSEAVVLESIAGAFETVETPPKEEDKSHKTKSEAALGLHALFNASQTSENSRGSAVDASSDATGTAERIMADAQYMPTAAAATIKSVKQSILDVASSTDAPMIYRDGEEVDSNGSDKSLKTRLANSTGTRSSASGDPPLLPSTASDSNTPSACSTSSAMTKKKTRNLFRDAIAIKQKLKKTSSPSAVSSQPPRKKNCLRPGNTHNKTDDNADDDCDDGSMNTLLLQSQESLPSMSNSPIVHHRTHSNDSQHNRSSNSSSSSNHSAHSCSVDIHAPDGNSSRVMQPLQHSASAAVANSPHSETLVPYGGHRYPYAKYPPHCHPYEPPPSPPYGYYYYRGPPPLHSHYGPHPYLPPHHIGGCGYLPPEHHPHSRVSRPPIDGAREGGGKAKRCLALPGHNLHESTLKDAKKQEQNKSSSNESVQTQESGKTPKTMTQSTLDGGSRDSFGPEGEGDGHRRFGFVEATPIAPKQKGGVAPSKIHYECQEFPPFYEGYYYYPLPHTPSTLSHYRHSSVHSASVSYYPPPHHDGAPPPPYLHPYIHFAHHPSSSPYMAPPYTAATHTNDISGEFSTPRKINANGSIVTPISSKSHASENYGHTSLSPFMNGSGPNDNNNLNNPNYSRKDKSLGLLCENFMAKYDKLEPVPANLRTNKEVTKLATDAPGICIDVAAKVLGVERRRIYDIINILEAINIVSRRCKNTYYWHGMGGLNVTFAKMQQEAIEMWREDALKNGLIKDNVDGNGNDKVDKPKSTPEPTDGTITPKKKKSSSGLAMLLLSAAKAAAKEAGDGNTNNETNSCLHTKGVLAKKENASVISKEKSLGKLSQKFVQLFLVGYDIISLTDACDKILGPSEEIVVPKLKKSTAMKEEEKSAKQLAAVAARGLKTKIRRLYDIANVMVSIGVVEKVNSGNSTNSQKNKPSFRWVYKVDPKDLPLLLWKEQKSNDDLDNREKEQEEANDDGSTKRTNHPKVTRNRDEVGKVKESAGSLVSSLSKRRALPAQSKSIVSDTNNVNDKGANCNDRDAVFTTSGKNLANRCTRRLKEFDC